MNSEEFNGKNGKVKVMYVRQEDDTDQRTPRGAKAGDRRTRDNRGDRNRRDQRNSRNERDSRPATGNRNVADNNSPWRQDVTDRRSARREPPRPSRYAQDRDEPVSPWQSSARLAQLAEEQLAEEQLTEEAPFDHGGISGKSAIDPEVLRRQRAEETHVYGENACQALFAHRPETIVRGWFVADAVPRFRKAMRWLADNRKAYHVVEDEELIRAAGTTHHGGVCFLIKKRSGTSIQDWLQQAGEQDCVLALDDVANPHNLGAIMRSCAHFGVGGVIVHDAAVLESGAAMRTAEGGAEYVQPIISEHLPQALAQFHKAGYQIVATSSQQGVPLFNSKLPKKMVLVLGQERDGVSAAVLAKSDLRIAISGTGQVDSLNVSVAAGVLLGEWWRQQQKAK